MTRQDCPSDFLRGYLDCALFTTDANPPSGQDYVECGRSEEMFPQLPDYFIEKAAADCTRFELENDTLLAASYTHDGYDAERAGADFWYTRNGHGVGYWCRDELPETLQNSLTAACKTYGGHDLSPDEIGQTES